MQLVPSASLAIWEDPDWTALPVRNGRIDLNGREQESLQLRLHGSRYAPETKPPPFEVLVGDKVRSVNLDVVEGTHIEVLLLSRVELQICVRGNDPSRTLVMVAAQRCQQLVVEGVQVQLRAGHGKERAGCTLTRATCRRGTLKLNSYKVTEVHMYDGTSLEVETARVGMVAIQRGSEIRLTSTHGPISTVALLGSKSPVNRPDLIFTHGSSVHCSVLEHAKIVLGSNVTLTVAKRARGLELRGKGRVRLNTYGEDLRFTEDITLDLAPHAQLIGASGTVRLGDVQQALISAQSLNRAQQQQKKKKSGSPELLEVHDAEDLEKLTNVSLHGVTFPVSMRALQVISGLSANALHVTPGIGEDLPGWRSNRFTFKSDPSDSTLRLEALYADALSNLAATKSSASYVRTVLGWASYRMRNLTSDSRMERAVLHLYRMIGYGERFLPAFTTYLVLAALCTVVSLIHRPMSFDPDGVQTFATGLIDWLLSPLKAFSLAREVQLDNHAGNLQLLARVLVSVPFVTGFICLRKYAKGRGRDDG